MEIIKAGICGHTLKNEGIEIFFDDCVIDDELLRVWIYCEGILIAALRGCDYEEFLKIWRDSEYNQISDYLRAAEDAPNNVSRTVEKSRTLEEAIESIRNRGK